MIPYLIALNFCSMLQVLCLSDSELNHVQCQYLQGDVTTASLQVDMPCHIVTTRMARLACRLSQ